MYQAYADGLRLESIVLKACTVAPTLLLQKPSRTSKSKDHVNRLQHRLDLWHKGKIQSVKANAYRRQDNCQNIQRTCVERKSPSGSWTTLCLKPQAVVKHEMSSVKDILTNKHPVGRTPPSSTLVGGIAEPTNPILFDCLNADTILQASILKEQQVLQAWMHKLGDVCVHHSNLSQPVSVLH